MLECGLYEKTIGTGLRRELTSAEDELAAQTEKLGSVESSRVLAAYAEAAVRRALDAIEGEDAPERQAKLVNGLIEELAQQVRKDDSGLSDTSKKTVSTSLRESLSSCFRLCHA